MPRAKACEMKEGLGSSLHRPTALGDGGAQHRHWGATWPIRGGLHLSRTSLPGIPTALSHCPRAPGGDRAEA